MKSATSNELRGPEASAKLRVNKHEILGRWEVLVRGQLKDARRESHRVLIDSLPKFIDDLAEALLEASILGRVRSNLVATAKEHAEDRAKQSDYTLEEVIQEYEILRKIIFEVLEENQPLARAERETILEAVSTGMAKAGSEYSQIAARREELVQVELEKTSEEFQAIFHLAAVGIGQVDLASGKHVRANAKLCEITGYSEVELKAMSPHELTHPEDRESDKNAYLNMIHLAKGAPYLAEKRYVRKDGSVIWVQVSATVVRDSSGRPFKTIGVLADITEKKLGSAQAQLLVAERDDLIARLRDERAAVEKLTNAMTHDMRTPLAAIKMAAQLAQMSQEKMTPADLLKRIVDNAGRADQMIEDLLDSNRIKSGAKLALDVRQTNLTELIETQVIPDLETIHGKRFTYKSVGDVSGYWSPKAIRRLIENLANNAVKYGREATPIAISAEGFDSQVRVSVHNWGNPLKADDQANLFKLFKRSAEAEASGVSGWGIGLTIVKGIADAHGATIEVSSFETTGTAFTVIFPRDSRLSARPNESRSLLS